MGCRKSGGRTAWQSGARTEFLRSTALSTACQCGAYPFVLNRTSKTPRVSRGKEKNTGTRHRSIYWCFRLSLRRHHRPKARPGSWEIHLDVFVGEPSKRGPLCCCGCQTANNSDEFCGRRELASVGEADSPDLPRSRRKAESKIGDIECAIRAVGQTGG